MFSLTLSQIPDFEARQAAFEAELALKKQNVQHTVVQPFRVAKDSRSKSKERVIEVLDCFVASFLMFSGH